MISRVRLSKGQEVPGFETRQVEPAGGFQKAFEYAAVFMSGWEILYSVISAVSPLVNGAIEVHPDRCLQVSPGSGFPTRCNRAAETATEEGDFFLCRRANHSVPQVQKFLTPNQVLNVHTKVALTVKREMDGQQHGSLCDQASASSSTITTAAEPPTPASLHDSQLDSESCSEEENREREAEDPNSQVRDEDLKYPGEREAPYQGRKSITLVEG